MQGVLLKLSRYILIAFVLLLGNIIKIQSQGLPSNYTGMIIDVKSITADLTNVGIGLCVNSYLEEPIIIRSNSFTGAAKTMKLKSLRWPEGELGESLLWSKPPYSKADPQPTAFGGTVDPYNNSVKFDQTTGMPQPTINFDQFIHLCQETGTEPFVIIPVDAVQKPDGVNSYVTEDQILQNAIEMVKYSKAKGYNVKYWEIGNENDLIISGSASGQKWSAIDYANFVVKISRLMKAQDPTIKIGANGMTTMSWWQTVVTIAGSDIDFLVPHRYMRDTQSMNAGTWWDNYKVAKSLNWDFASTITDANNAIDQYASTSDKDRIMIAVTETSSYKPNGTSYYSSDNAMGKSIIFFEMLGQILSFDRLIYAHYWAAHSWTNKANDIRNALGANNEILANGRVIQLWNETILPKKVSIIPSNMTADPDINIYGFYDPNSIKVNIVVLNRASGSKSVPIGVKGIYVNNKTSDRVLQFKGTDQDDPNPTYNQIANVTTDANSSLIMNVPAFSITLISFTSDKVSGTGVTITPDRTSININDTQQLTAIVSPSNATNAEIKCWNSSNLLIATVSATGIVTGISAGNANIITTTMDGNLTNSCAITVLPVIDCKATGNILMQRWDGILYTDLNSLTGNINYPNNPSGSSLLSSFEAPSNAGDDYGLKVSGYICAQNTGSYTFWISGDDNSQLWLSPDDNPNNKVKIAESAWTRIQEWNKYPSQKSAPINLIQGHSYYVEALLKQEAGTDNLAVGWAKPSQSTTSPSEVIPGSVLSPWAVVLTANPDLISNSISIYPNPLVGKDLFIKLGNLTNQGNIFVSIYDITGRMVYQNSIFHQNDKDFKINIDRSVFSKGIYIVKVGNYVFGEQVKKMVVS